MHPGRWSAPWEPSEIISFPRDPCITAAPCRLPLAFDGHLKWTPSKNQCSIGPHQTEGFYRLVGRGRVAPVWRGEERERLMAALMEIPRRELLDEARVRVHFSGFISGRWNPADSLFPLAPSLSLLVVSISPLCPLMSTPLLLSVCSFPLLSFFICMVRHLHYPQYYFNNGGGVIKKPFPIEIKWMCSILVKLTVY